MNKRKNSLILVLVSMMCLALLGNAQSVEGELFPVDIDISLWIGVGPAGVALAMDYWKGLGLDVNFHVIEDMPANNASWAGGHSDIRELTVGSFALAAPEYPGICFLQIDASVGGDKIFATRDIQTLSDMIGKRVSYGLASPQQEVILYVLDKEEIELRSIIHEATNDTRLSAQWLERGYVDVAVTWPPWSLILEDDPRFHVLISTADLEEEILPSGFMAQTKFAEEHPDILKKFVQGWWMAIDFMEENFEESLVYMAEFLQMSVDDLRPALQHELVFYTPERNAEVFGLNSDRDNDKVPEFHRIFNLFSRL